MLLISLVQFIALFLQQELAQYITPQPSLEPYLAQLELQHEIESDYYHACGGW
ncbi:MULTISPECIES: hypothetical protein [unclassified Microcoleus]|uniref:hypothetical protein n=1 Tax=unclassified Microcoleus TaxID=2642155 RepID=UPI002FD44C2F